MLSLQRRCYAVTLMAASQLKSEDKKDVIIALIMKGMKES
jgi:hypothetical protein